MADVLKLGIQVLAKGAKKEIEDTAKALGGLDKMAGKVATVGFAAMAAAGAAATAAVIATTKATISLSADLNTLAKEARQVGASVEELDIAQGALDILTSGALRAGRAFQDLQRNLADARDGTGEAKDALEKLGLTVDDLQGKTLPETLATVADRFGGLKDEAEQSQVAMDIFGRSGRVMVAALREGGDAIRGAADDIERSGFVSEAAALQAESLQDSILLLRRSVDTLKREALVPLMPVLSGVADFMADMAVGFRETGEDAVDLGGIVHAVFMEQVLPAVFTAGTEGSKALKGLRVTMLGIIATAQGAETALRLAEYSVQSLGVAIGMVDESKPLESLTAGIEALARLHQTQDDLSIATRDFANADEEALAAFDALLVSIRSAASVDLPDLGDAFGDAGDGASGIAAGVDDLNKAAEEAAKLAQQEADALDRLAQSVRFVGLDDAAVSAARFADNLLLLDSALDADLITADQYYERVKALRAELDAVGDASGRMADSNVEAWNEMDSAASFYGSTLGSVSQFVGIVGDATQAMLGENTKEAKKSAKAIFIVQKALALAEATVNMAMAISEANASAPTPYNIPAIVAAGVTGGVQIATIAATTIAGVADAGLTADQVRKATQGGFSTIQIQSGEAIIDRSGTSEISRMLALQRVQMERDSRNRSQHAGGGGNVYLDGYAVGEVMGGRFARQDERGLDYRATERY